MTTQIRGFIAVALMSTASWSVVAQALAPARPASVATSAASASQPSGYGYRSAFDGYRRFDEQRVLPWRESNELVGRIGGWQAYARENAGGEAMPAGGHDMRKPASGVAAPTAPAPTPAASEPVPSPHGGRIPPKTP